MDAEHLIHEYRHEQYLNGKKGEVLEEVEDCVPLRMENAYLQEIERGGNDEEQDAE
jgi:hypothetical protein